MLPLRNILCPTDFSQPSYQALEAAAELALHFDAHLTVVTVIPPQPGPLATADGLGTPAAAEGPSPDDLRRQTEIRLAETVHERVPDEIQVRLVVSMGDPAEEILAAADRESADALVIATHGRTGWRRFLFGSVAERVVRHSLCPVLTIRQPGDHDHHLEAYEHAAGA